MKTNLHVSHTETNLGFAVCDENGKTVCVTKDKSAAIFFAAAPDLLVALEVMTSHVELMVEGQNDEVSNMIRAKVKAASAAIAKARGES